MTHPSFALRAFQAADITAYGDLFQRVFSHAPWSEVHTLDAITKAVQSTMAKRGFVGLVAEQENRSLGFLTAYPVRLFPLQPSFYYLDQLFVDDQCQRLGVGRALFERALDFLGGKGMLLLTKPQTPAEHFYLKRGFKAILPFLRIRGKVIMVRAGGKEKGKP